MTQAVIEDRSRPTAVGDIWATLTILRTVKLEPGCASVIQSLANYAQAADLVISAGAAERYAAFTPRRILEIRAGPSIRGTLTVTFM